MLKSGCRRRNCLSMLGIPSMVGGRHIIPWRVHAAAEGHRSAGCPLMLQLQAGAHMAARRRTLGCWEAARVFWTEIKEFY